MFIDHEHKLADPYEAIICLLFDVFLLVLDHYDKHS